MINLIYNKDIAALEKRGSLTPDELKLVRLKGAKESIIQQHCHTLFNELAMQLEKRFGKKVAVFVQMDNGDTSAGSLKPHQRMALFKRKKAEGSKKGFPDVSLFLGSPCGQRNKSIFIEFKRMGTPSQIDLTDEQIFYNNWLNEVGFDAYITNNVVFFETEILKKVKQFYLET